MFHWRFKWSYIQMKSLARRAVFIPFTNGETEAPRGILKHVQFFCRFCLVFLTWMHPSRCSNGRCWPELNFLMSET